MRELAFEAEIRREVVPDANAESEAVIRGGSADIRRRADERRYRPRVRLRERLRASRGCRSREKNERQYEKTSKYTNRLPYTSTPDMAGYSFRR
jgi:hypothetical protein